MHHALTGSNVRNDNGGIATNTLDHNAFHEVNNELGAIERREHLTFAQVAGEGHGGNNMVQEHVRQKVNRNVTETIETKRSEERHEGLIRRPKPCQLSRRVGNCVEKSPM